MAPTHPSAISAVILASLTLAWLGGCDDEPADDPGADSPKLQQFTSCSDAKQYLVDAFVDGYIYDRYRGCWWELDDGGGDDDDDGGGDGDPGAPSDWSETNVQNEGIDEPDLVKSTGEHIYVAQRGELTVVDSWPAEQTSRLASLPIAGDPFALLLHDDRAAVLSSLLGPEDAPELLDGDETGVLLTIVDVSDPAAPTALREIELRGDYADARMIDGQIYVVLTRGYSMDWPWQELMELDLPTAPCGASDKKIHETVAELRTILRPVVEECVTTEAIREMLPHVTDGAPGDPKTDDRLMDCSDIYHPSMAAGGTLLTLVHVDIADDPGAPVSAAGAMAGAWSVYASQDRLYVAEGSPLYRWDDERPRRSTRIHQFALDGGEPGYQASGAVDGWLNNRFSMDEHDGHLRIATSQWGDSVTNNVFVLERHGDAIDVIGEVRGLAPNEEIRAARFQGDRGFLITFQAPIFDPLITLDLSDPTAPAAVGELGMPGFSTYLHPVGEDLLLATSVDTEGLEGGGFGITAEAISLFDVSDFAHPVLLDRFTLDLDLESGGASMHTEALWNAHAFTFYHDVLALPVYDGGFSGLLLLHVDAVDGLGELGRVDHADLPDGSECLHEGHCDQVTMHRGLMIDDNIYSLSDYGLKVNELMAPENERAALRFWPDAT